jgi:hypothetical protein
MMSPFSRSEVESAFARYWKIGCVDEEWSAWTDLFHPDAEYVDHFWGRMYGREEIRLWIAAVMKGVPEIYTVLDWFAVDDEKVVFRCLNRRDNPDESGPAYFDFPGLSVLWYAGDGLWAAEEDYWDRDGARRTSIEYAEACTRAGVSTPDQRMTRRYWPEEPSWAGRREPPAPSWLGHDEIEPITKPRQLRELLSPLRP